MHARFERINAIGPFEMEVLGVDFHATLTHHFHLDLTHPGS